MLRPSAGDKALLPTGRPTDLIHFPSGRPIEATLLCGANPAVLVLARDIHAGDSPPVLPPGFLAPKGEEQPAAWRVDQGLLGIVDHLRREGAKK